MAVNMGSADSKDLKEELPQSNFSVVAIETEDVEACWVCGHLTVEIHCRIICPNCGFTRDCSDP